MDKFKKNPYIKKLLKFQQINNDNATIINYNYTKNLHVWHNDNAVSHEFVHYLKSIGFNILHEILIWFNYKNTDQTIFVIAHNYGYDDIVGSTKKHHTSYLDFELYYETQIKHCNCDPVAIPIVLYFNGDTISHSNILFIKRNIANKIIVEYFEPYGYHTSYDVLFEIKYLLNQLFAHKIKCVTDIEIMNVSKYSDIQYVLRFTEYNKSCFMICMWYVINRFILKHTDPFYISEKMDLYLKNGSPAYNIKAIIILFLQFVNIDDNGIINGKKMIDKKLLNEFNNRI